MTVSTPTFDLIFDRIQRKEERIARIEKNYARAEAKIDALYEEPLTVKRERRIAFLEGINYSREARLANLAEDNAFLDDLLPKDSITAEPTFFGDPLTGEVTWLQFTITATDSPYDDSLFPTGRDKGLAYRTFGRGPKPGGGTRGWGRTVGTSDTVEEDAVTTFVRGTNAWSEQWNYGSLFTFSVLDNFGTKEEGFQDTSTLLAQQYDPTTYPVVITSDPPIL